MFSILITSTVPKEKINNDRSVFYVLKEPCSKKMTRNTSVCSIWFKIKRYTWSRLIGLSCYE